jgi:hypothetical protein
MWLKRSSGANSCKQSPTKFKYCSEPDTNLKNSGTESKPVLIWIATGTRQEFAILSSWDSSNI